MSLQDSSECILLLCNYSTLAEQVRHLLQGSRIQNEKRALVGFLTEVQNFSVALPLSRKGQMMHPRVSDTLLIKSLDDSYLLDESLQSGWKKNNCTFTLYAPQSEILGD